VANQANVTRYEATRGGGARKDGRPIAPSSCRDVRSAVVGFSGYPTEHVGWAQYRALGAAALDLCAVAEGCLDAFVDVHTGPSLGPWDYLGGVLVCVEAGAAVGELDGRDLVVRRPEERRRPMAAATLELLCALADLFGPRD
jgi:myo-inositol-1(or 4)-monophosphatase